MGESEVLESAPPATPYYHKELYGDPNIVMDKEQMLQLLDFPDSHSMFPSPAEDLKRKNMSVPILHGNEETTKGIAANDLGSLLEQFLEYEEKQVPPRLVPRNDAAVKNSGERVFSGKLQDHNYAIPAFVASKENCLAEDAVTVPDADVVMESVCCDSGDKDQEESNKECESQAPSPVSPVESVNDHESSNKENIQDEPKTSGQCFDKSPQREDERSQSPCNERSVELEKCWKSDTCRRDREPKRRKRSYSSDPDDSDYDDARDSSRRPSFHSQEKRPQSYGTSSDEESDRECKRYSLRRFERVRPRNKPENHGRNLRSRDHSIRLERNEMPRNRRGRKEEKSNRPYTYDIEHERKLNFKFNRDTKDTAKEERRIVYIGKISESMTKDDVRKRFRPFGPIEKISVHIREKGDNYAFVTYFEPESAVDAIEKGNSDSSKTKLDLCFGGRRKFCGGTYVDFDSNTSKLEKQQELLQEDRAPVPVSSEADFDVLLKMFQKEREKR